MKIQFYVLFIIFVFFVAGCSSDSSFYKEDKDEHGCFLDSGYKWCESQKRCIKEWEICEEGHACVSACGNGVCDELVCIAPGCPCKEDYRNCIEDCAG